jgi:hypothetical protein
MAPSRRGGNGVTVKGVLDGTGEKKSQKAEWDEYVKVFKGK